MFFSRLTQISACLVLATGSLPLFAAPWQQHVVRQLNDGAPPIQLPAKLQIVTEAWNRVAAVPYLVYMPEKDRLLMLVSCDYPPERKPVHYAMVLESDDHGVTWSDPRPIARDEQGKPVGLGLGLTYLRQGKVLAYAAEQEGNRWFSSDYGATWANPVPVGPTPDGNAWAIWCPPLVVYNQATGAVTQMAETGYAVFPPADNEPTHAQAYLRFSADEGHTWSDASCVPQWKGVNEVALLLAANGDWVAACRTDIPASLKGETLDHYEGLGVSISKDNGNTWSNLNMLYEYGRHHPSLLLMPNGQIVMTYVVRKGYIDTPDGYPQFGIEAVLSRNNGQTWDLTQRYILHSWTGNRKGPNAWWASSQATSSVLLPDGSILTAFGTGYRSEPGPDGLPSPRDVGLVLWQLGNKPPNDDRTVRDVPLDSELRNIIDPATGKPPLSSSDEGR